MKMEGQIIPSNDVIVNQQSSGDVINQNTGAQQVGQEGQTQDQQIKPDQQTPERDDYWKNRSYELERKLSNLTEELPKIIETTVTKSTQTQQATQQYAEKDIPMLKKFIRENPDSAEADWAENEIMRIQKDSILNVFKEERQKERKESEDRQIQQHAQNAVVSDPRFKDAFITDQYGNKQWNNNSRLTQLMAQLMQEPRLKSQPDALLLAAEIAHSRLSIIPQTQQQLNSLQRENEQLKNKTMVEGSGVPMQQGNIDEYMDALDGLRKTGSMRDATAAVKAYMARRK